MTTSIVARNIRVRSQKAMHGIHEPSATDTSEDNIIDFLFLTSVIGPGIPALGRPAMSGRSSSSARIRMAPTPSDAPLPLRLSAEVCCFMPRSRGFPIGRLLNEIYNDSLQVALMPRHTYDCGRRNNAGRNVFRTENMRPDNVKSEHRKTKQSIKNRKVT